jgi:hypothetical protein
MRVIFERVPCASEVVRHTANNFRMEVDRCFDSGSMVRHWSFAAYIKARPGYGNIICHLTEHVRNGPFDPERDIYCARCVGFVPSSASKLV